MDDITEDQLMVESVRQKQSRFAKMAAGLILKAYELGYEVTFGEAFRSDEQCEINAAGESGRALIAQDLMDTSPVLARAILNNGKADGIRLSIHGLKLAIDLNLFKNGVYLEGTEAHRPLGEWWEKQAPDARWGGRFRDGNHYSLEHAGIK